MDAKHNILNIAKKPFIGEIIIFFAIFLTLGAVSGTLNHFGLTGEDKQTLFKGYVFVGAIYVVGSLGFRVYKKLSIWR